MAEEIKMASVREAAKEGGYISDVEDFDEDTTGVEDGDILEQGSTYYYKMIRAGDVDRFNCTTTCEEDYRLCDVNSLSGKETTVTATLNYRVTFNSYASDYGTTLYLPISIGGLATTNIPITVGSEVTSGEIEIRMSGTTYETYANYQEISGSAGPMVYASTGYAYTNANASYTINGVECTYIPGGVSEFPINSEGAYMHWIRIYCNW